VEKRRIFIALRWALLAVLVAAGVWYAARHPELLRALGRLSIPFLAAMVVFELAARALQGFQFKLLASVFGVRLRFTEWFGLAVCKGMYGYLMPGRPGAGVQAVYMKKRHDLPFAHFGSLFAATGALDLVAGALLGCLASAIDLATSRSAQPGFLALFAVLLLCSIGACVALMAGAKVAAHVPTRMLRTFAENVRDGLKLLAGRRGVLGAVLVFGVLRLGGASLAFWMACMGLEMNVTWTQALIVGSFASFGMFLPLTPAGIGISEGIISATGRILGIGAEMAMLAALVCRAVSMALVFGLGWAFNHVLLGGMVAGAPSQPDADEKKGDGS